MKYQFGLSILVLALTATFSVGCMKVKKKDEVVQQTATGMQAGSNPEQDMNNFTEIASWFTPNTSVGVDFNYLKDSKNVEFIFSDSLSRLLYVEIASDSQTHQFRVDVSESKKWKSPYVSDKIVTYSFYDSDLPSKQLLSIVDVMPILDLNLINDLDLYTEFKMTSNTQKIYFKSLILKKGKKLLLQNFSGRIWIERLESDGGFIQTFNTDQTAQVGQSGRDSGQVQIKIHQSSGFLNLFVVGENGGAGDRAKDPDAQINGQNGKNGKAAFYTKPSAAARDSGAIGICTVGENGGDGGDGQKGYPGNNGLAGGTVQEYQIFAIDEKIKINIFYKYGNFGLGSKGGSGGLAGLGGQGGSRLEAFGCAGGSSGTSGTAGSAGNDGKNGSDGLIMPSKLFINGHSVLFNNEN